MKTVLKNSLLIFLLCVLYACPYEEIGGHKYITFINKSGMSIDVQDVWWGHITTSDSIYQCHIPSILINTDSTFLFESTDRRRIWENDFKSIPFIQFLVMESRIFEKYAIPDFDCDTIRKYVPVLHCYQLKLEDLQRMNWTVVYPPEE